MPDRVAAAIAGVFTALGVIALIVGDTEGRLIGLTAIVLFGGGALVVRAGRAEDVDSRGQPRWLARARRRHLLPTLVAGLALVVGAILAFPVVNGNGAAVAVTWGATAVGVILLGRSAAVLITVGAPSDRDTTERP